MGILADFFVASTADAMAYHNAGGPPEMGDHLGVRAFRNFIDIHLDTLWDVIDDAHEPQPATETIAVEPQSWLFELSDELIAALAGLPDDLVPSVASRWAQTDELQADGADADDAIEVIQALRELAGRARSLNQPMFLWGSL